jgi:hypothetical protein
MLISIVLGVVVLASFSVLGFVVLRVVLEAPDRLTSIGLSIPVGSGILTWFLFIMSWAGIPLTALTCAVVWLLLVGLCLGLLRLGWPRAEVHRWVRPADQGRLDRWVRRATWSVFGFLIGLAVFLSVGNAFGSWDAVAIWASKGLGIVSEKTIFAGEIWGAWGLAYPLNIPLQIGLFQIFGQDLLPLSKVIFPIYLASLGIGAYRFWRLQGVGGLLAGLGLTFLASVPIFFLHGTEGYANLPLTAYLVQAVLWGMLGLSTDDRRTLLMSGVLLGLASWTRAEAVGYCLAAVVGLTVSFWLAGRRSFHIVWWLAPLAVLAGVWFIFGWGNVNSSHLGGAMRTFRSGILGGELHLRELYLIPRLLYDRAQELTRWGFLFEVAAVLVLARIHMVNPRRHPVIFSSFVVTALVSTAVVGIWYVRSYSLSSTYITVLNRSFDRAFFPAAALMVITGIRMYAAERVAPAEDSSGVPGAAPGSA